jgi:hypothetical protein
MTKDVVATKKRKEVMNETKLVTTQPLFVTRQPLRQRDKPQFRGGQGKPMTSTTTRRTNHSMVSLNLSGPKLG